MSSPFCHFLWGSAFPLQQLPVDLPVSFDVDVVLTIIAAVFVLFVTQPVPIDATAVGLVVVLALLGEWTGVSPEQAVSGFSNPATLTVLAMFVLSEGVRRTGVIQILTRKLIAFAGDNEFKQLLATVTLSGPPGGVVSNVSVVAVLIPAIMNLARQTKTSPSKLLIPLSFASMLGGMLTVGRHLTPARIKPAASSTDAFGMTDYLTDVVVMEDSPLVGSRVTELSEADLDVFQIVRGNRTLAHGLGSERVQAGDVILVQASDQVLDRIARDTNVAIAGEDRWEEFDRSKIPIALGILAGALGLAALDVLTLMVSALTGVAAMFFTGILTPEDAYEAIDWEVIFMVAGVIPLGIAVEASGTAALIADLVVPVSVLLPVIAVLGLFYLGTAVITEMVSNSASVVLLLPIGVEVASQLGANPFAFVMAVTFAASTPLLILSDRNFHNRRVSRTDLATEFRPERPTEVHVLLSGSMILPAITSWNISTPRGVENLHVIIAGSMTPVGYQTNLIVYGPGGYKFTDFARVGAPLQLILTVVTTVGIVFFWGL
jgi:di/tricarboxylate transporter